MGRETTSTIIDVWRHQIAAAVPDRSRWRSLGVRATRAIRAVVVDASRGRLSLWAMSLVYTTLLSLVPLLAVCFSVLKGFGVHHQIEPVLGGFLAPLGERGDQITSNVVDFVERVQVGVLGSAGLLFLLYTVLSLVQKVERAFNEIWSTDEPRPLGQRLSSYLSVLLIGPVLVVTVLGMTASAASSDAFQWWLGVQAVGPALEIVLQLAPYLVVIGGFALAYAWIPNTKVDAGAALFGALFAGIAWETAGYGFASFVASSGRYDAIYSGFALLMLFMVWTYVSWFVLLAGSSLAYHFQNPDDERAASDSRSWGLERLGLRVAARVASRFEASQAHETPRQLARALEASEDDVARVLDRLVAADLIVEAASDGPVYVPSRPPGSIRASEIVAALRPDSGPARPGPRTDALAERVDRAIDAALADCTMKTVGRRPASARTREGDSDMDTATIRDRLRREGRLDEEWFHLFALEEMVRVLRSEDEYGKNGHTGLLLLKTRHLRVVLEVARENNEIGEHTVHGPTVVHVLEGSLHLESAGETRIAHAGEMVVVPHDRPRTLRAQGDAAFLWALSLEG